MFIPCLRLLQRLRLLKAIVDLYLKQMSIDLRIYVETRVSKIWLGASKISSTNILYQKVV